MKRFSGGKYEALKEIFERAGETRRKNEYINLFVKHRFYEEIVIERV